MMLEAVSKLGRQSAGVLNDGDPLTFRAGANHSSRNWITFLP